MRFINELHEGDRLNGIYLCKQKQAATTKNGKPYENVILQDKTGMLDGKIWDPNSLGIDDFDALDYIEVVGDVTTFAGAMQLNIKRVRKAHEGEYNPADYLPVSENSTDDMYGSGKTAAERSLRRAALHCDGRRIQHGWGYLSAARSGGTEEGLQGLSYRG